MRVLASDNKRKHGKLQMESAWGRRRNDSGKNYEADQEDGSGKGGLALL